MPPNAVVAFDRLDLAFTPRRWPFADERRAEIDAHFATLRGDKPELWNGRVLLLHDYEVAAGVFRGAYLETDFASFLAWRDWGYPDRGVMNCFAQAALRGGDDGFLLGEMAGHTANAGRVYFAGGTPDPGDVVGDRVDLAGSVLRELREETGLSAADVAPVSGWHAVFSGQRIAMLKVLETRLPAADLRRRILGFLGGEAKPELADIRIVRGPADLDPRMPDFVQAFLNHVWETGSD